MMVSLSSLSKEQWESIVRFAEWAAIILTFLGAASGVVFILANRPLKKLEAAERQHEHEMSQAEIAGAVAIAATANERAAKLELDAATQRERAAVAERLLLEIQERTKDRHIEAPQRAALVDELRRSGANGTMDVSCSPEDEPCKFADELAAVFEDAGWHVIKGGRLTMTIAGVSTKGLFLMSGGLGATPNTARLTLLRDILSRANLPVSPKWLAGDFDDPSGTIGLWVGPK